MTKPIEGKADWSKIRVAIAAARWNSMITDEMVEGACEVLEGKGVKEENIYLVRCPGSYELPLTCRWLIDELQPDGVIAIGAVIRGQTPHFDYVCDAVNRGVMDLNISTGRPVLFGVLTTDTIEQALERAGKERGNKGAEAALALCEMISIKDGLQNFTR